MLTSYAANTVSVVLFFMLLSRTAGDWFTKLIIPSSLSAVGSRDLGETTNACCVKGSRAESPVSPAPLGQPPSPKEHGTEIYSKRRVRGKRQMTRNNFSEFFFLFKSESGYPVGLGHYQKVRICYESWKSQRSPQAQVHLHWPSTIRGFVQLPSLRTQNTERTISELSATANSWQHLCEGDVSKGMNKQCDATPILGRYYREDG